MRKASAYFLLGICLCLLLTGCGGPHGAASSPSPAPTPRTGEVVTTAPPGSTPTPRETPPAETGSLAQPLEAYGALRSDTGTALNLLADWHCVAVSAQNVKLTVTLLLESYSLSVGERQLNALTINGETFTFRTDPVEVPAGSEEKTVSRLYEWSETLPLGTDGRLHADLTVVWNFQGSYSGTELETISLSGRIEA